MGLRVNFGKAQGPVVSIEKNIQRRLRLGRNVSVSKDDVGVLTGALKKHHADDQFRHLDNKLGGKTARDIRREIGLSHDLSRSDKRFLKNEVTSLEKGTFGQKKGSPQTNATGLSKFRMKVESGESNDPNKLNGPGIGGVLPPDNFKLAA